MRGRTLAGAAILISLGWLPATAQTISVSVRGPGKVTGTGIDCPSDCREDFLPTNIGGRRPSPPHPVVLTARPNRESTFSGWGGACSGTAPTCTVSVSSRGANASAQFMVPPPPPPPDAGGQPTVPADSGGPAPDVPRGGGEPASLMGMTLYHNQVRAQVQSATPLPPLTWSDSLAATAAAWGAVCLNGHNPNRSIGHPYYVGENIFYSGGPVTAQTAVYLWAAEKSNYRVGCAVGSCPNLTFPNSIICNYGPAGNSGGLPY